MGRNLTVNLKKLCIGFITFIICFTFTGCWNYREMESLWIVAGAAIDWDENDNKYIITAELLRPKGGKESQMVPDLISFTGDTLFEAMRKGITVGGKRLYWAHTQVLIISDTVAKNGIIQILDVLNRGGEFRSDIWLVVSREKTAKGILSTKMKLYDAISFQLAEAFRAQQYSANYINSEAWYFQKDFSNEGISPVLSAVRIVKNNNEEIPEISGAAVFKQDKLVGYIDGNEAESLLFIRNKLKGGVISVKDVANTKADVSLEVIGNKTTITPQIEDGNITMYINIKIHVGITEMGGDKNFISEEGRAELKNAAKATIKKQIEELIEKTQNNFGSDVLGFGKRIQKKMPGTWKKLVLNWDEAFKTVKTSINVEVNIVSSSSSYKPITAGD